MSALPEPGAVLAFTLRPGVVLQLRVLASVGDARCVVLTRATGPKLARTAALFQVKALDHHAWNRPMLGGWVSEPLPSAVRVLGHVPLRAEEPQRVVHPEAWVKVPKKTAAMARRVLPLSSWSSLLDDARAQWRWEHERAAVEAEDAVQQAARARSLEAALAASKAEEVERRKKGLAGLRGRRFFTVWDSEKPKAVVTAAEKAVREALTSLEGKSPKQAARRLAALVRTFNALDARYGFDTVDTEDVMDAVSLLAEACRVSPEDYDAVVDAVREF